MLERGECLQYDKREIDKRKKLSFHCFRVKTKTKKKFFIAKFWVFLFCLSVCLNGNEERNFLISFTSQAFAFKLCHVSSFSFQSLWQNNLNKKALHIQVITSLSTLHLLSRRAAHEKVECGNERRKKKSLFASISHRRTCYEYETNFLFSSSREMSAPKINLQLNWILFALLWNRVKLSFMRDRRRSFIDMANFISIGAIATSQLFSSKINPSGI